MIENYLTVNRLRYRPYRIESVRCFGWNFF